MKTKAVVVLGLALAGLAGCAYHGPATVSGTRNEYNTALQQTAAQELLLNVVRLRFDDSVFFMTVERISSEMSFRRAAGLSALTLERGLGATKLAVDAGSIAVSETPTAYYVPLSGEVFSRRVMAPLELSTLALLVDSEIPVERVLAVAVRSINGLNNDPADIASYANFRQMLTHIGALQRRGLAVIGKLPDDDSQLALRLPPAGYHDYDADALRALLSLTGARDVFPLSPGVSGGALRPDVVAVHPRSVYSTMKHLSRGVLAAPEDSVSDRAMFDGLQAGQLKVNVTPDLPASAHVAVPYGRQWYSIADGDHESKATFQLLSLLMRLQTGNATAAPAPLSLSVGR